MELKLVRRALPGHVCAHGVALAPLDVYLAESEGTAPRSMYCAECRRDEQDELDATLAGFVPDPADTVPTDRAPAQP
jgi:hypothetical protein